MATSLVAALAFVWVVTALADNARVRASELQSREDKQRAIVAQRAEERERRKAQAAAERERRLGYIHQIVLAEREWHSNNTPKAEQLLDSCAPSFAAGNGFT